MKNTVNNEGRKNDRKDDRTRWELMPLDCLEDIARVYTEGAKKYGDNNWQNLDNGYERYKGALLRHLYASESKEFDEETGCRHLAQVCWNAIAMLWLSKHKSNEDKESSYETFVNSVLGKEKASKDYNANNSNYKRNISSNGIDYEYLIKNGERLAWSTIGLPDSSVQNQLYKITDNNGTSYYLTYPSYNSQIDKLNKEQAKIVLDEFINTSQVIMNSFKRVKTDEFGREDRQDSRESTSNDCSTDSDTKGR